MGIQLQGTNIATVAEFACILFLNTHFSNTNWIFEIWKSLHVYFQSQTFGAWYDDTTRTITVHSMEVVGLSTSAWNPLYYPYR